MFLVIVKCPKSLSRRLQSLSIERTLEFVILPSGKELTHTFVQKIARKNISSKLPLLHFSFQNSTGMNHMTDVCNNVLWTDRPKWSFLKCKTCLAKTKHCSHPRNFVPIVKLGGEVMTWALFASARPRQPTTIESTMHSSLYECIVEENRRQSVQQLKLSQR